MGLKMNSWAGSIRHDIGSKIRVALLFSNLMKIKYSLC